MMFSFRSSINGEPNVDARFRIESWGKGDKVEREIAIVDHIAIAQAAYDAAVREWPMKWISLKKARAASFVGNERVSIVTGLATIASAYFGTNSDPRCPTSVPPEKRPM
jgi:hypothetical protein